MIIPSKSYNEFVGSSYKTIHVDDILKLENNKNNMRKDLREIKIYVNDKSREIQNKLYELNKNITWSNNERSVMREDYPFLYVDYFGILSFCNHMCAFTNHRYKEISDEVILSMEERKDYSKYEFKPLEPVLVRENKEVCWKLNFYVTERKTHSSL